MGSERDWNLPGRLPVIDGDDYILDELPYDYR
jgi:hypothetical protein